MSIKPRAGRIKSLSALLNKDTSNLRQIINKAEHLKHIETLLHTNLPADWCNLIRVADFTGNHLLLFTASAANLTRLRFLEKQLLSNMRQHLPELTKIEVKVRPQAPQPTAVTRQLQITAPTQAKLKQLAATTDHPGLKAALLKLANKPLTTPPTTAKTPTENTPASP